MNPRAAVTSAPVIDTIANRWSPRAFDTDHAIPDGKLRGAFEAARWAPSASNTQPWRFILARRGSENFAKIQASLVDFNQKWAQHASALVVNIAVLSDADGNPQRWAEYDLGQAVASLTLQAHSEGLYVHQMGGFDASAIRDSFALEQRFEPVSVAAIGELGSAHSLPDALKEREQAPRTRLDLDEIVLLRA
ncbi:MAG: nitroreductase family protein [Leucobacter sp.]